LKHSAAGVGVLVLVASAGVARAEPVDGTAHAPSRLHPRKVALADPRAPSTARASASVAPPARKEEDGSNGPLDPFRIGAFTGVGFPRPVSIEGFIKIEKIIGLGLEYSFLPSVTLGGVDTELNAIMGDLRVFPFENGFFIGVGAGRQHLSAASAVGIAQLGGATPGITVDTIILNPRIGFLATWGWGLTLGIDAGLQLPLAATTHSTIPSGVSLSPDPSGMANAFGRNVLPTVDLLRIGLLL
jgi:hypothetical protein